MKANATLRWFLAALLISAWSCSPQSEGFVATRFHNTTAHYNAYFLANEEIVAIESSINDGQDWNYNRILPVVPLFDSTDAAGFTAQSEECLKKASLIIERHPKSKWVDDAYILVGKARMYSYDFTNAVETFKYVNTKSKDENARHEALVNLMRTFIEAGEHKNAQAVSDYLKKEKLDKTNLESLYIMRAYFAQVKEDLKATVKNLTLAFPLIKKREKKARIAFTIGQIYQELGRDSKSFEYYQKALRSSPSYELSFYTKLNMGQVTTLSDEGNLKKIRKYFSKLLKDRKNEEYKDKIYYEMGRFEFKTYHLDEAIVNYKNSVQSSVGNERQKAYSYYELAKIHYDSLQNYEVASAYYDSTVASMPKDEEFYEDLVKRQEALKEFVVNINIVRKNDSLIALTNMDSLELIGMLEEIINEELAQEEEEAKRQKKLDRLKAVAQANTDPFEEFQEVGTNQNNKGGWYFYNPSLVQAGKAAFQRTWGPRTLEDHWRRSKKAAILQATEDGEESEGLETDSVKVDSAAAAALAALDTLSELEKRSRSYLATVPFDEEAKIKLYDETEEALYNLGFIYNFSLEEKRNAISAFDRVIEEFDTSSFRPESFYQNYLIFKGLEKEDTALIYADSLKAQYPDNVFARLIDNPNYLEDNDRAVAQLVRDYNTAYKLIENGFYDQAYQLVDSTIVNCTVPNDFLDNLEFLKVIISSKTREEYLYQFEINHFLRENPKSDLVAYANGLKSSIETYQSELFSSSIGRFNHPYDSIYYVIIRSETPASEENNAILKEIIGDSSNYRFSDLLVDQKKYILMIKDFGSSREAEAFLHKNIKDTFDVACVISDQNFKEGYETKSLDYYFQAKGLMTVKEALKTTAKVEETPQKDVVKSETKEEKVKKVYAVGEEQPMPKGGMGAFYSFVGKEMSYPREAQRNGVQGKVFVSFVVNEDGSLSDIKVPYGIGYGCDEEAIRVFKLSPKWNPGKNSGKPVQVKMLLPLTFKLDGGEPIFNPKEIANRVSNYNSPTGARPKNGIKGFYKSIKKNLKYPEEARKKGIEGQVFIAFKVETSGKLSEFEIVDGLGYGCDEEALRVFKLQPNWFPAKPEGTPVESEMILPVNFQKKRAKR